MKDNRPRVYICDENREKRSGISARAVLSSAGIVGGRVRMGEKEGVPRVYAVRVQGAAVKPVTREDKKAGQVERTTTEPAEKEGAKLTESERRAVEFFEAVEAEKSIATATEQSGGASDIPKEELVTAVFPELPLVASGEEREWARSGRRKRKGKKNRHVSF